MSIEPLLAPLDASGSTRSPWIEMTSSSSKTPKLPRRAPHGARGLKYLDFRYLDERHKSGSTRSPWIEIDSSLIRVLTLSVGLHTEPVD